MIQLSCVEILNHGSLEEVDPTAKGNYLKPEAQPQEKHALLMHLYLSFNEVHPFNWKTSLWSREILPSPSSAIVVIVGKLAVSSLQPKFRL
jgi:hypothetical protein